MVAHNSLLLHEMTFLPREGRSARRIIRRRNEEETAEGKFRGEGEEKKWSRGCESVERERTNFSHIILKFTDERVETVAADP